MKSALRRLILAMAFLGAIALAPSDADAKKYKSWSLHRSICTAQWDLQISVIFRAEEQDVLDRYAHVKSGLSYRAFDEKARAEFKRQFAGKTSDFAEQIWIDFLSDYDPAEVRALIASLYKYDDKTEQERELIKAVHLEIESRLDLYEKDFKKQHGVAVDMESRLYPMRPYCD